MIFNILIVVIIISIYVLMIVKRNIKVNEDLSKLEKLETEYEKFYPIGDDYFRIKHYPNYLSFFEQFDSYKYLTYYDSSNIVATCCFCKINTNMNYCADLKSKNIVNNITFKFFCYAVINLGLTNFFGITMKPNKIIEKITNKYFIQEYTELYLYQTKLTKHIYKCLKLIFGEFYFTDGYKQLILKSNNSPIKILHIASNNDIYKPKMCKYNDSYEIMFCLEKSNKYIKSLNIKETSKMSVYGFNNGNTNWDFIRTYMI